MKFKNHNGIISQIPHHQHITSNILTFAEYFLSNKQNTNSHSYFVQVGVLFLLTSNTLLTSKYS